MGRLWVSRGRDRGAIGITITRLANHISSINLLTFSKPRISSLRSQICAFFPTFNEKLNLYDQNPQSSGHFLKDFMKLLYFFGTNQYI